MLKAEIGIVAFVSLIGTNALAADMAVKATWTGFYVGGNLLPAPPR